MMRRSDGSDEDKRNETIAVVACVIISVLIINGACVTCVLGKKKKQRSQGEV